VFLFFFKTYSIVSGVSLNLHYTKIVCHVVDSTLSKFIKGFNIYTLTMMSSILAWQSHKVGLRNHYIKQCADNRRLGYDVSYEEIQRISICLVWKMRNFMAHFSYHLQDKEWRYPMTVVCTYS